MGIGFEGLLHVDTTGVSGPAAGAAALDVELVIAVGGLAELDLRLVRLAPLRDSRLAVEGGIERLVAQLVHFSPPAVAANAAAAAAAAVWRFRAVLLGLLDADAKLDKQRPQRGDAAGDDAQRRLDDGPDGRVDRVEQEVGRDTDPLHVEDAYDLGHSGAAVRSSAWVPLAPRFAVRDLQNAHAEQDGNADLGLQVDAHMPKHGDGQ